MTTMNATVGQFAAGGRREPRRQLIDTPGLLRLLLGGTWLLAAMFLLAARVGVERHRRAVQVIGRDAAPSIIAAQRLRTTFARTHADVILLLRGDGPASAAYDAGRRESADGLVAAAENITYGDAERQPIRRMVDEFGRYGAAVARARATDGGTSTATVLDADRLLHDGLLADADALDRANRDALEQAFGAQRRDAAWGTAWTALAGLALVAVLAVTQLFLTRRTRRMLNPSLLAATAATVFCLALVLTKLGSSADALRSAKADAFDSISALWQARAVAADCFATRTAGTSPARAAGDAGRLVSCSDEMPLDVAVSEAAGGSVPPQCHGLLADELRNVTYPGEREAAVVALQSYAAYASDGSRTSYKRFDDAMATALGVNQQEFDAGVETGFEAVGGLWRWAAAAALFAGVGALTGLRPRLREYAT